MNLFASDFDGTLYFMRQEVKIKPSDLEAIRCFQNKGNLFGLCTGRSLKGVLLVLEQEIPFDFMILASGALILDRNKNKIYKKCISLDLLKEVYENYVNHVWVVIQANDTVYSIGLDFPLQTPIESLDELTGADIYGLSFGVDTPEIASRIAKEINEKYSEQLNAFQNVCNVDIVAKGCSKGSAMNFIREYFHPDRSGAIGDSYNDLPMLKEVDEPFTFPYAPGEVKAYAGEKNTVSSIEQALCLFSK